MNWNKISEKVPEFPCGPKLAFLAGIEAAAKRLEEIRPRYGGPVDPEVINAWAAFNEAVKLLREL